MALAILKIKMMPESPETDLEAIKKELAVVVEGMGAKLHSVEEEPIAFGLIAVIATIAWPEEKGIDEAEQKLSGIKGVVGAEVIDYRRAFG